MARRYANYKCVYCGNENATQQGDHIFARGFFPEDRRENLPKAPACIECGNRKSKRETYLTAVLPFGGRHGDALRSLEGQVPSRLAHNPRLKSTLGTGFEQRSDDGHYDLPFEADALTDLFADIAVGLLWFHTRLYLPDDFGRCAFLPADDLAHRLVPLFSVPGQTYKGNIGQGTFDYTARISADESPSSVWIFRIMSGLIMRGDPRLPHATVSSVAAVIATHQTIEQVRQVWG